MEVKSQKKNEESKEKKEVINSNDEYSIKRQHKEDRLRNLLGPFDKYITSLECILVWDYPIVFIIILFLINFLFWLYTITPFYFLLASCLFFFLSVQFISNHVWPLINDSDDSLDGWVKLHASEEDQFDLIRSASHLLMLFDSVYSACEDLKKNNPQKFNVLGLFFFFLFLIISFFVNDFYFVYFLVMLLVCWPGIRHNHIPERLFSVIRPHLASLEKALHIRKTVNKKKLRQRLGKKEPKRKKKKKMEEEEDGSLEDDSDADLEQFLPEEDEIVPVFRKKGGEEEEDDDDDDTAREYLPHVHALSESDENTEDEEFMPDIQSFASNDASWNVVEGSVDKRNRSPRRSKVKASKDAEVDKDEEKKKKKTKKSDGSVGGGGPVVSEDVFAEGLSFDNEDDLDSVTPPTSQPGPLIGQLITQAISTSDHSNQSAETSGLLGKAMGGFEFLKKALSSAYSTNGGGEGGGKVAGGGVAVDEDVDFFQTELDEEEEF